MQKKTTWGFKNLNLVKALEKERKTKTRGERDAEKDAQRGAQRDARKDARRDARRANAEHENLY